MFYAVQRCFSTDRRITAISQEQVPSAVRGPQNLVGIRRGSTTDTGQKQTHTTHTTITRRPSSALVAFPEAPRSSTRPASLPTTSAERGCVMVHLHVSKYGSNKIKSDCFTLMQRK